MHDRPTRVIRLTAYIGAFRSARIHRSTVSWIDASARWATKWVRLKPASRQTPVIDTSVTGVGDEQAAVSANDAFYQTINYKHLISD
jgi:hypothetical protein